MRIRTSIVAGVVILVGSVGLISFAPNVKVQNRRTFTFVPKEIPITIIPLKVGDETIPVEIQCDPVLVTEPGALEFSCILVNKTNKSIRASSVRYGVIFDSNGTQERIDRLDTVDRFIHPDLSEVKKPLEPGESQPVLPSGPIMQHDAIFRGLELAAVYVEFSDGTSVGTNAESVELIKQIRIGAAHYKEALRGEYFTKRNSVDAVLLRLKEDVAPGDPRFPNLQQRSGANRYRKFLQGKFEKDGKVGLRKILDK